MSLSSGRRLAAASAPSASNEREGPSISCVPSDVLRASCRTRCIWECSRCCPSRIASATTASHSRGGAAKSPPTWLALGSISTVPAGSHHGFGDVTVRCFDMTGDSLSLCGLGRIRRARSTPSNPFRRSEVTWPASALFEPDQCVWRYRVCRGSLRLFALHRRRRPPTARSALSEGWHAGDGGSAGQGHLGRSVCSGDVGLRRQACRRLMRRTWPRDPQSQPSDRNNKADRLR